MVLAVAGVASAVHDFILVFKSVHESSDKAVRDEWDAFDRNQAASIVGFIVGGLGCCGFTATFFF